MGIDMFSNESPPNKLYQLTNSQGENRIKWSHGKKMYADGTSLPRTTIPSFLTPLSGWMTVDQSAKFFAERENNISLDSSKWLCALTHPVLAVLLNRVTYDIDEPIVWECSGKVKYLTIDKIAFCSELVSERTVLTPVICLSSYIDFGFHCVSKVLPDRLFEEWLINWADGTERNCRRAYEMAIYLERKYNPYKADDELNQMEVAVLAALYLCRAAIALTSSKMMFKKKRLVQYNSAQAALTANYAAYLGGKKDFNLQNLAELTLAA